MERRGQAGMGYGQAFLLVFGFLIASVIIFLFGMWVGRDLTESRLSEEPVVQLPVPSRPTPGGAAGAAAEGVGQEFYADLKKKAYEQLRTPAAATVSPTHESLRLPTPTGQLARDTPTQALPTPTRTLPALRPTQPAPPPPTRAAAPAPPTAAPREAGAGGPWTVQVGATMDSNEALAITLRLRGLGFEAYTVQAPLRGQTWYRIRVGRFASRDEARAVEGRLRQTGEFKGAYVTSQ
jgi:cell division septation protein DedD